MSERFYCDQCDVVSRTQGEHISHFLGIEHRTLVRQAQIVAERKFPGRWVHTYFLKDGEFVPVVKAEKTADVALLRVYSKDHLLKTVALLGRNLPEDVKIKDTSFEDLAKKTEETVTEEVERFATDRPPVPGPGGKTGWWVTVGGGRKIFIEAGKSSFSGTLGKVFRGLGTAALVTTTAFIGLQLWKLRKTVGFYTSTRGAGILTKRFTAPLKKEASSFIFGQAGRSAPSGLLNRVGRGVLAFMRRSDQDVGEDIERQPQEILPADFLFKVALPLAGLYLWKFDAAVARQNKEVIDFIDAIEKKHPPYLNPASKISSLALAETAFYDGAVNLLTGIFMLASQGKDSGTPTEAFKAGVWLDKTNYPVNEFLEAYKTVVNSTRS